MADREWYLVQCKVGETQRALENLENQSYECFLPMIGVEKIRNRKRRLVQEPLFPGYLFIHMDQWEDNWQPIRSTRGVTKLVAFGGYPVAVDNDLVELLKQRCAQQEMLAALNEGERILIKEGPFAGLEAIFESYDGNERVIILLNFLNKQQKLTLPIGSVSKAQ